LFLRNNLLRHRPIMLKLIFITIEWLATTDLKNNKNNLKKIKT